MGSLLDWVLLGPFPSDPLPERLPDGVSRSGFHTDFLSALGGEAQAVLKPDTIVTYLMPNGEQRIVKAQRVAPELEDSDCPDFKHILYNKHILERDYDQAVAYAFCTLVSERDQTVYAYLGSDGSPKVWLNGDLVHQYWRDTRQTKPWQDSFTLDLKAGLNHLLLKIDNRRGWWGFQIEIYDADHHTAGIRRALQGVVLQGVEIRQDGVTVAPVLAPMPIDFALPVVAQLEDRSGRVLARTRGLSGQTLHVAPEHAHNGPAMLTVAVDDPAWSGLKSQSVMCYLGDFANALATRQKRLQTAISDLTFLPQCWRCTYAGLLAWLDHFFDGTLPSGFPSPNDAWAIRTLDFADELTTALERKVNFLAEKRGVAFPVWFETTAPDGTSYHGNYLVTLPADACAGMEDHPLLLHLHGSSLVVKKITFGDANIPYFDAAPFIRVSPMATYPLRGRAWDIGFLNAVLRDVCTRLPVDVDRIYLQGGSGGGKGSWEWALANPEHFAALSILCGGEGMPFRAARLRHLPVWVFNGELDLASYPFLPELMVNALRRVGGDVRYTLFPDAAHAISQGIDKAAWQAWYLRHTRSALPVPEDPLSALHLDEDGLSDVQMIQIPAKTMLTLSARERLRYPQDHMYRAAMKLYQAYRKPTGSEPVRQADGVVFIRTMNGSAQMYLNVPGASDLGGQGDLEAVSLPAMDAARVVIHCTDRWAVLQEKIEQLYGQLAAMGFQRTGEERVTLLSIQDRVGYRFFEVYIGVKSV